MEVLGHSSIRVTMDVYTFVWPDTQRAAFDRVSDALAGVDGNRPDGDDDTAGVIAAIWTRLPSTIAVNAKTRGPVDLSTGPLACCALGRIRTCNLLIRSQMLYPLSYECLAFRAFVPGRRCGNNIT
jgi:hypothetical protein